MEIAARPITPAVEPPEAHDPATDLTATGKQIVLDQLAQFPDEASLHEIVEHLRMVAAVREALAEADRGEGTPMEEFKKQMATWDF